MAQQIQVRRDTLANWTSANPTLAQGEISFVTDTGNIKIGDGSSNWATLSYFTAGTAAVVSVNGNTGVVVLTKSSLSLGNVDNTSDANKPVSTAQASAIALKANKAGDTFTGVVIVEGDFNGTGNVNLKAQLSDPATPASGVALFSDNTEKFGFVGQSGFAAIINDQNLTERREYSLPDADGNIMVDPMSADGDMIYYDSGIQRLPIGNEDDILRVMGGIPSWEAENLTQDFGDGSDGNLTLSGALTLNQIPYYNTLTLNAGAALNPNGYPIYCRVLDLTNAPAGAITRNGNPGFNGIASTVGQNAGAGLTANILGASTAGTNGANGASNAGVQATAPSGSTPSNGGAGGSNGASGAGGSGAAAAAAAGGTASNNVHFGRFEYQFLRAAISITGGAGGRGGNSGGGDGANSSRGGPGGGGGGGIIVIYAANIITGGSTPAGVISCRGGLGGTQPNAPATGNVGGASGAGGGGGGYVYLTYVNKTGPTVVGLVNCSGGNGGNGGNGLGTGIGGQGGSGGAGGNIQTYNVTTGAGLLVPSVVGGTGNAGSGTVGGAGGSGGSCLLNL
jgi:hypothetical protein